ncbi:hypothetical protein NL676_034122 [Syzygium grande]|nr:hypothetical protein NL676_034122 [Syzygium grande]
MENQIILAEDKKHYPTAEEVYGEDVETRVMYEDEQPLEQPIIEPVWNIKFEVGVKDSCTHASTQFLIGLMSNPALVWNVALVGHLRHGKTVFMDMLVEQTRHISTFDVNNEKHMRYTDTRIDEQERRISIKAIPMSLVLEDSNSKSYLCNITDTPGHGRHEEDEDLPDKRSEEPAESDGEDAAAGANGWITASNDVDMENQIVLAEDKKHYPTAEEVYGEDVETRVMYEDEQPLEQPIIEPVWNIKFEVGVKDSCTHASTQFLIGLMSNPALVWNFALVGHLRHGKTVFMDMLVEQTRHISTFDVNNEKHMRYTDTRIDEQERRISIKAIPMSLVLEDSNSKSYLCNITDTPGHVNFSDEMTAALRLADGAALIVDAAEGVMVIILSFLL